MHRKEKHTGILVLLMFTLVLVLISLMVGAYEGMRMATSRALSSSSVSSTSSSEASSSTASSVETSASSSSSSSSSSTSSSTSANIKVYFSKNPDSNDDPTKVFAVNRVSPDLSVAKAAITELLKGPTTGETTLGYFTQVKVTGSSNCGGANFSVSIDASKKATLKFCKDFVLAGVISDAQAKTQIDTTLKQFPTITKVVILNKEGDCLFDASGSNACLVD